MLYQLSKSSPMQIQEIGTAIALTDFTAALNELLCLATGILCTSNIYRFGYLFRENHARFHATFRLHVNSVRQTKISSLGFAHSRDASHLVKRTYLWLFNAPPTKHARPCALPISWQCHIYISMSVGNGFRGECIRSASPHTLRSRGAPRRHIFRLISHRRATCTYIVTSHWRQTMRSTPIDYTLWWTILETP